jgi:hypothetical protein
MPMSLLIVQSALIVNVLHTDHTDPGSSLTVVDGDGPVLNEKHHALIEFDIFLLGYVNGQRERNSSGEQGEKKRKTTYHRIIVSEMNVGLGDIDRPIQSPLAYVEDVELIRRGFPVYDS